MRERPSRPGEGRRRPRAALSGASPTVRAAARAPGRPAAARPAAPRPAAGRRSGGGPGTTTRTSAPRPRGRFTARAVVLAVVLGALGLSYILPLRIYLAQQAEIAELRAEQEQQRTHVEELALEAALWSDDDYIRIQARKRLYFGEPGERLLLVPDDEQAPLATGFDPDDVPEPPEIWWDTLWMGIRNADRGGPGPVAELVDDPADDPSGPAPEEGGDDSEPGAGS